MPDEPTGTGESLDVQIGRLEDALRALRYDLELSEGDIETYIRVTRAIATPSPLESVKATGSAPPTMWPPCTPWPCGGGGGGGDGFGDIGS